MNTGSKGGGQLERLSNEGEAVELFAAKEIFSEGLGGPH